MKKTQIRSSSELNNDEEQQCREVENKSRVDWEESMCVIVLLQGFETAGGESDDRKSSLTVEQRL